MSNNEDICFNVEKKQKKCNGSGLFDPHCACAKSDRKTGSTLPNCKSDHSSPGASPESKMPSVLFFSVANIQKNKQKKRSNREDDSELCGLHCHTLRFSLSLMTTKYE